MNGTRPVAKYSKDNNNTAQLANEFNNFYMAISSPKISQIGNYRITKEIGEGAFGKVYLATHILLNVNVVLKCGLIDDPNIVREIYYHKQLKHKNIVSLYEVIKTENHLWIAMEYCEGGELYYLVYEKRRLELNECRHIFFQIMLGVQFVHSMNLSHRDLKLENILLSDKKKSCVKLTDFGFIREFNPQSRRFLTTICGTTVYMAPELLSGQKYSGFAIDVWSLGIILYTMLYGVLPFDDDDEMKTKSKIVNEDPTFADFVPEEVNQLILKMLNKDPTKRIGVGEILNSSFLIDSYNKHLEKTQKKVIGDGESILSINQHYNSMKRPFDTRIERELIGKLQKLNVDIDELQASIYGNETNSLTAFYELLLTREFSKKKKRYIRDKKRKYFEARNSLRKSRKKVKSALSMSDQLSGSQPLERIISTLSITSNKNTSKTNLARLSTYSRKSTDNSDLRNNSPRSPQNAHFNIDRDNSIRNSVGESGRTGVTEQLQAISPTSTKIDAPLHRIVSFVPQERRPSDTASTGESVKKPNKSGKILNKLQFWKKDKNDGDKEDSTSVASKMSEKYENDTGSGNSELQLQQSPQRFQHSQTSFEVGGFEQTPATTGSDIRPNETGLDPALDVQASGSNHLTPTSGEGRGLTRTRPSSMISQISQISRLSQLSTMLSESELDILDETDTLDDDDDEDDAYDSSISMSQDGRSSTGVVIGSSRIPTKKRPSYRRGMSSDQSIQSVSTTGGQSTVKKKSSMSRVTSNSSDDTPSESKYGDEVPPMNGESNNAHSQFMVKSKPSSLVTPTPVLHSNSIHPNFNTNEMERMQGYRSHSPPFNFKSKSTPRNEKTSRKLFSPNFKNNNVPHNYQDTKQVNDWLSNPLNNNTGSHGYANKTMYGPIIDEEDEDDV
ncbi:Protein kinase domain family protein [Candida parapsilosis]|uniref:non-specific serine/threonine protein kinase n=1 Tax=Candida parapsilosis TaxID=5480 RepID=A0A8X7NRN4_CANPA|nr:Protein kinase domain family protein [Candida parapsilosis]KAF6056757.1 Protein kinase domain family protein [Candida parapsilosis]KAF6059692.1 Protein kinase domain family protein [Candida parapsilosis]KAF6068445.1 Protein kinase domain family protein [Candida parapsilosis]KAI5901986.1 putative serine/threonine-protein kinase [Candida parapsilosis]